MRLDDKPTLHVVADDILVRMHEVDIEEDAGVTVLEAEHADEAMMLRERHDAAQPFFPISTCPEA